MQGTWQAVCREIGYEVEKEVPIGEGKAVDLVATKDGRRIVIKVETGKSNIRSNREKCRNARFQKVVRIDTPRLSHKVRVFYSRNPIQSE